MNTIFNVNEYTNINDPYPQIKWKGPTVSQISAGVRLNKLTNKTDILNNAVSGRRIFKALPLKIYRREIASVSLKTCNPRTSMKINDFDMPGGTIISNFSNVGNTRTGLVNTTEILYENNSCQHPSTNNTVNKAMCNTFLSTEANALRRVRSSGMIKRKFNTSANNDTYYTSTAQYLNSRNLSFQQNQYFHIRTGDATVKPGTAKAVRNIYQANGINHCNNPSQNYVPIYYKPNNSQFGRQGAVSSSDLIARKKYNTITTSASSFRSAYGNQTANALAYGIPDYGYTIKDKVGYPLKQTPKFSKYSTIMRKCPVRKFSRAI